MIIIFFCMSSRYSDRQDRTDSGVSRRRFVQAAGAAGITTTLAGCTGGNGGSDAVVVSADQEFVSGADEVIAALREAGLDTDIEVDIES